MTMMLTTLSCVGTIQDANKALTKASSNTNITKVEYSGIESARAISSDKVEITFPQSTLDSDNVTYVVRYDGLQIPKYIFGTSLRPDYKGFLRYTVSDLQINKSYAFSVQIRNVKTGIESNNTVLKQAKTFGNSTANFNGISELRNLNGAEGTTGIEVFWIPAVTKGTLVTKDEIDPIEYRVTVIDGTNLNPGSMNDINFGSPNRRVVSVGSSKRSVIVNGLLSGRKYFAQVRAVHYGTTLFASDPNYLVEQNTSYLEISTYTDDLASINFDDSSFLVSFPPGSGGLYSLKTSWDAPVGNYDHFRIYYAVNGSTNITNYLNNQSGDAICEGTETVDPLINCKKFSSSSTVNNLITNLSPNVNYDLVLAICVTTDCQLGKRIISSPVSRTTTPGVADFAGITTIDPAKSLENLDQITLNFALPNFLSGNISGYVVQYYGNDPSSTLVYSLNDIDVVNTTGLNVLPYNVYTDTKLEISGIDPLSVDQYCFKIIPFSYNLDGSKNFGDTSTILPKCIFPSIKAPTQIEFTGLASNSSCDYSNNSVTLFWSPPSSGVFANFELFYQNSISSFEFGNAINWESNDYERILLNSSETFIKLSGLQPGTTYRFGMLSLYSSIDGPIRSEYNTNFFQCSF